VTAAPLAITSLSVGGKNFPSLYADTYGGIIPLQINGTGFQSTDTVTSVPNANFQSTPTITGTQIVIYLGLDTAHSLLIFLEI
jgi:hypothetical protein